MGLFEKIIGKTTKPAGTELAKVDTSDRVVIVKGKKYFELFEDGNGKFRAKHKDGKWLMTEDYLCMNYHDAEKFSTLEGCQGAAIRYMKNQEINLVGTIEFIPNR